MATATWEFNPFTRKLDKTYKVAIEALEDTYVRLEIFQEVSTTSGTLSVPTGGTIVLDPYAEDEDALCTIIPITGQRPIEELERTSSHVVVTVALSGTGNTTYTLSGTPQGSQYAIQYVIDIQLVNYRSMDRNVILATDEVLDFNKFNVSETDPATSTTKQGDVWIDIS